MPNITNAVFEFDNNYVYSNKIVRIIRIPAHVYPEKYCCVHDLYMTACDVAFDAAVLCFVQDIDQPPPYTAQDCSTVNNTSE